jgi:hypothetical protein
VNGNTLSRLAAGALERTMARLVWIAISALVVALVTGCAYVEERFQDDTGNPKFEVGYRAGETYRLRADGQIVSVASNGCLPAKPTERLELWSPQIVARNSAFPDYVKFIAMVPAGTTVRVEGLEHNYTFAIPPVPGDSQVLRAYGTVESSKGRWAHVRIPNDHNANWSFVTGTYVMAFPPDHGFLELVAHSAQVEPP